MGLSEISEIPDGTLLCTAVLLFLSVSAGDLFLSGQQTSEQRL
jgi:hypothetical protein